VRAALGFLTIGALFLLIVSRKTSPLVALIAVPILAALAAGFGLSTAKFIIAGIQQIAPVAAMFVFAILYFGIASDAGTLEPLVGAIVRAAGARLAVGTRCGGRSRRQ
jgi:CitMHS family citrate-Mg2+:H+ or citrate-Ca2+:H+ symporter